MGFNFTPEVLVVDDRLENLDLLEAVLGKLDAKLELIQSPLDAIRKIDEKEYALIILDIQMPQMDGFALAEKIRSGTKNQSTPIIFLTAFYLDKESEQRGYECGCADFIMKPFNSTILKNKVNIFLDLFKNRKQKEEQNKKLNNALRDKELFENRLKNLASNYRSIIEGQSEMILKVDSSLKIEFANKAFTDFFDYTLDGVSVNSLAEINKELSDQIITAIKQMNGKKESIIMEKSIKNHLSDQRWFEWSIFKQIEFDNMNYHIVGRDVSDRKLLKDSLIKKELMVRKIQKLARVGSFEWDSYTKIFRGSTEFYRIYEISEKEIDHVLENVKAKLHPDDLSGFDKVFHTIPNKNQKLELKHRILTREKKLRHIHVELNIEYNEKLDVHTYTGVAWDVTEDMEMETTFKHSLGFERDEYHDRAFIELNKDNEIVFINDFGCKLLECEDLKMIPYQNILKFIPDLHQEKAKDLFNFSEQKRDFAFDVLSIQSKNQKVKKVILVAFSYQNSNGGGVRILMNELPQPKMDHSNNGAFRAVVSDLQENEREFDKNAEELQDRMDQELLVNEYHRKLLAQKSELETLGKMASSVVNEINQPLSGISMVIDNILLRLSKGIVEKDYIEDKCSQVFKDIDRIKAFLSQIGIFNSAQHESCEDSVNVNLVVQDAVNLIKKQYKNSNVEIKLKVDPDSLFICGDKYKLQKAIVNILNNSFDSIGEKLKKENVKEINEDGIQIKTKLVDKDVVVSIKDFGEGIDSKNLNYIFEPFFSTKKDGVNSGLSLYVSKNIIQKMNGEIKVKSKKNEFTEMKLIFPFEQKVEKKEVF
ncbi:response regulator [Marinifilum caeruleilacunae]|uniref:histidine kinase n=1 Tax=Marinifilum caeruleilacunae TaxID=2499076 RepID=A0ABX1WV99_9BACT|nr:response regulator [Marinifilum caeruleilacunae]NOU60024.1 response regulator [Marinifilum caeruleilacunae]